MKKIYTIVFFISISLVLAAIVSTAMYGLKFGVDFKGGSVIDLNFKNGRPQISEMQTLLFTEIGLKDAVISPVGQNEIVIKSGELTEQNHQDILKKISTKFASSGMEELKFDSVGPIIGNELKSQSMSAIVIVLLAIIFYIAMVFRKLSRTISGWAMGIAAIVALAHDVIIPIGVFALLGHFYGIEISAVFVAAILTVLGYSVSDTVVVFDRVRENIIKGGVGEGFGAVVHKSIMQTLTRSLNTTFTTLLSLIAIYLFGGESIKYFALALIMGIFLGAYSSIFVASPLLVWWNRKKRSQR